MDLETRSHAAHAAQLRVWLRMLSLSQRVEKQVRTGLRDDFGTTLPRFDLMAQLERHPQGMKMTELSRRLMVTGGNVTGVTRQLVADGLVERTGVAGDRRAFMVRLTPAGQTQFAAMAQAHEAWIVTAFAELNDGELSHLHQLLGKLKAAALPTARTQAPETLV